MKRTYVIIFTLLGLFSGCDKEGIDGKNSLVDLFIEPVGENCSSGGYKIISGLDLNNNGSLDENEIQNTEYICNGDNGQNGINSLINVTPEPLGDFCDYGGIRVESGLDQNDNGILDPNEISSINYVCNGEEGQSSGEISTIRLPFNLAYKWRNLNNNWTSEVQDGLIYSFNNLEYIDFDSIGFIAQFHRGETSDTIWLRLYDYTASQGISNSELFSAIPDSQLEDPNNRTLKSGNFANSILSGPRTIGIQFRKETSEPRGISIHHAEIILHRSE